MMCFLAQGLSGSGWCHKLNFKQATLSGPPSSHEGRAWVPSTVFPRVQPPASHSDGMRRMRHAWHLPQDVTAAISARSPARKWSTAAPTLITCSEHQTWGFKLGLGAASCAQPSSDISMCRAAHNAVAPTFLGVKWAISPMPI